MAQMVEELSVLTHGMEYKGKRPRTVERPEHMRPTPTRLVRDDEGNVVVSIESVRRGVETLRGTQHRVVNR
jgi:hypothetical protein